MKIKKILLVFPPYPIPKLFPKRVQIPLGVASIAAILLKHNYIVKVIDSVVEGWEKSRNVDSNHIQYGLDLEDILGIIRREQPDMVGISCMFGVQLGNALKLAEMIKLEKNDTIVSMGGAHASVAASDILKQADNIDYIVIGEADETFINLLSALNKEPNSSIKGIDGLAYKDNAGRLILKEKLNFISDLDSLPYPERDLLPMEKYFLINRPHGTVSKYARSTSIITSRGCPADCIFCSIHSVWGYKFRARSPENVVDEIESLNSKYGIKEFQIEDDNMSLDAQRAEKICDLIIQRNLKVNFTTPNGIALWTMNKELLKKMKQAGFYRLTFAIESGSEHTLKEIIRKPLNLNKVKEIIDQAVNLGFIIDTFYVIGFPGESPEDLKKTFQLSRRLNVNSVKYFIATPYIGTRLYTQAKSKNMLVNSLNSDQANASAVKAAINTEYFSASQIDRIWLRETLKTQLILFLRHPINYTREILAEYFFKDSSLIFQFLNKFIKHKNSVMINK
ncbi:MAG: radical SAM protein [Candidatus Omnitrophota bacterium]